jgi:hypothetical protein
VNATAAGLLAKSGEAVKSGPIGLAVILILCIVCYFLFKSMSKHLKTVREDFPAEASTEPEPPQPATDAERVETQAVETNHADAERAADQSAERPPAGA